MAAVAAKFLIGILVYCEGLLILLQIEPMPHAHMEGIKIKALELVKNYCSCVLRFS